ncbi:MAG: DUF1735 and LamG domain-containing protein [Proteiniphilum sp.]|nr:DUF1735 and LamG domain-containing protein [Proteiniphilum sp.]
MNGMNKKTFTVILLAGLLFSCKQADNFENKIYFQDAQTGNTKTFSVYETPQKFPLTIASSDIVSQDTYAFLRVSEGLIDDYNKQYNTAYKLLPPTFYSLSSDTVRIEKNTAASKTVYITIKELPMGENYILPLVLAEGGGDFSVLNASGTLFMAFKPGILTPAANIRNRYLEVPQFAKNEKLKSINQLSYEARVKVHAWSTASHKISSLMGIEENFLLRFGDVNIEANQLQLAGGPYPVTSNTRFGLDTWYHVAVVYDGATIKLYVNGKEDNMVNAPRGPINLTDTWAYGFHIGFSANGRLINATISECRVWTKALSAAEINNNMCYVDPETPGLLAYWKFNEGTGAKIKDYSPNNYTTDLSGIPVWEEGVKCPGE